MARWSKRTGGHLVEVSLEGAERTTPQPSLLALADRPNVSLVGTFATLLTSEMPLAYLAVPAALAPSVGRVLTAVDGRPLAMSQYALQRLLSDGTVRRHAATLARHHLCRAALVRGAFRRLPGVVVAGASIDGTTTVLLPAALDAATVAEHAGRRGVLVSAIAEFSLSGSTVNGLVVDTGNVNDETATAAVRTLAGLCRQLADRCSSRTAA